jgi:hypothetical protein
VRVFGRSSARLGLPRFSASVSVPRVRAVVQRPVWDLHRELGRPQLPVWIYVLREMDKDRSINSIAKDLPHTYKTVHRVATTTEEAIYQRREEWREVLTGEVGASGRALDARPAGPDARSGGLS